VSDQIFDESFSAPAPEVPLGPRLIGLAILCTVLFGLATIVGLLANTYA
jgi:hypothetical protein